MKRFLLNAMKEVGLENYYFLTCDVGYGILEDLAPRLGMRFLNVGVAETNAMGIAAGLASATEKVFIYSIASFAITRALEHLKLDIAFHQKNVTVIGVGAGFCYGAQGYSHYALDDLSHAMAIPDLGIFNPATPTELVWSLQKINQMTSPSYLRLSRYHRSLSTMVTAEVSANSYQVCAGEKLSIVVSGVLLATVLELRQELREDWQIISVPCLRPLALEDVVLQLSTRKILVVEECIAVGSLGERLSKFLLEQQVPVEKYRALTVANIFPLQFGSEEFMREQFSLDTAGIKKAIWELLGVDRNR